MSCLQAGPRPLEVGGEIYFARMFFQEHVLRVDAEQRVAGGEITVRSSAQKLL